MESVKSQLPPGDGLAVRAIGVGSDLPSPHTCRVELLPGEARLKARAPVQSDVQTLTLPGTPSRRFAGAGKRSPQI